MENSSSRLSSCSLRCFLSGSTSSSTAMMFCSTVKSAKDRGFLRQIADAEPGPLIHRQHRDVLAVDA